MRVLFMLIFASSFLLPAARAEILDEFRSEYPSAAARLNETYSHLKIVATETRTDGKGKPLWVVRGEYLREGDLVRSVRTTIASKTATATVGFERAIGGSPEKYFDISRPNNQRRFAFHDFGRETADDFATKARMACIPLFATCCADAVRIDSFLKSPAVHLLSAESTVLDGSPVVIVIAEQVAPNIPRSEIHLYFLPGSWAFAGWTNPLLSGNESMSKPHTSLEVRVGYTNRDPLKIKYIDKWTARPEAPGMKLDEQSFSIESIEFGAIPASKFTLAALGVQEPAGPETKSKLRWFLLINGPLCAVVGTWLLIVFYRRRSRASQA